MTTVVHEASLAKHNAPSVSAGTTLNVLGLVEALRNYEDPDRVRKDLLDLSTSCPTLVPRRGTVVLDSGLRMELLTLHGTFSMIFRNTQYKTPLQIYITESYPSSAPLCYIVPTAGLSLRVGHQNVDQSGLVSLPYLKGWSAASHNLVELVASISIVFGAEPPLFATPVTSVPTLPKTVKALDASAERGCVQVLCPGYGRTGTMSMKKALEILGFGPCYHMFTILTKHVNDHPQLWLDGLQGRKLAVNKILDGYKAVVDWPATDFYKEILDANPEAKVVVPLRDPDACWGSLASAIHNKNPAAAAWGVFFMEVLKTNDRLLRHMLRNIKTVNMENEEVKADYIRHNQEVSAHVRAEKGRELLEFSVEQGWGPLCEFLDVPVPDVPFPRVNSGAELREWYKRRNRHGWLLMAATMTVAGSSVALASFFGGKRIGGALAATEMAVLASRFRKALAMRKVH